MKQFHILTLMPEVINEYFSRSVMGRAKSKRYFDVITYDLRKWGIGKRKQVDDVPYGGGPGMVLMLEPIYKTIKSIENKISRRKKHQKTIKILFSTKGKLFNDKVAIDLSNFDNIIMICGRYEGVDERVAKYLVDMEISVGDFVLSGGEIPAMLVIDVVARKILGVLGTSESLEEIKGSYPVYSRPNKFYVDGSEKLSWDVPNVLLSGNHKKIKEWRRRNGK